MTTLHSLGAYEVHNGCVASLSFFPDGERLVSATQAWDREEEDVVGELKVWSPSAGVVAAQRDAACGSDVAVSPDGRLLAWGGTSGQLRIFDGVTFQELELVQVEDKNCNLSPVLFSLDGKLLIA